MPFPVESYRLHKKQMDFGSSGQGVVTTTALISDGVELINAVEFLEFDYEDDAVQLILCECCGTTGCDYGSWVSLRKIGDKIVFIPATAVMRENEWGDPGRYGPPHYMSKKGLPAFPKDLYVQMQRELTQFPMIDRIPECTALETLDLLQIIAPAGVLGSFGKEAKVRTDAVVAVTSGDMDHELEILEQLIVSVRGGTDLYAVQPQRVVEFHLNTEGFPSWKPFGYDQRGPVLHLGAVLED